MSANLNTSEEYDRDIIVDRLEKVLAPKPKELEKNWAGLFIWIAVSWIAFCAFFPLGLILFILTPFVFAPIFGRHIKKYTDEIEAECKNIPKKVYEDGECSNCSHKWTTVV
jgi:hypothetical protein